MSSILVVEDNVDISTMLVDLLEMHGYRAEASTDGEAVTRALDDPPDLILLDLLMPLMDGREVYRLLRVDARTAHVPVVFMTAIGRASPSVGELAGLGKVPRLDKPFDIKQLLETVRTYVGPGEEHNQ